MQNKTKLIIIIIIILGIIGIASMIIYKKVSQKRYLENINITQNVELKTKDDILQALEKKDSFLLVIGDTRCQYCNKYKDNALTYYVNDTPKYPLYFMYGNQNFDSLTELKDFLLMNFGQTYDASPTTYLIIDGEPKGYTEGNIDLFELYDFIKSKEKKK